MTVSREQVPTFARPVIWSRATADRPTFARLVFAWRATVGRPTGFRRFGLEACAVVLLLTASIASAEAQNITAEQVPPYDQPRVYRTIDSRIAIGRSVHVAADEEISDVVVVIGGKLRVDGRVRGDAIVVGGTIELGPKSDVRGDVVAVGGGIVREPGSQLRGNVSDVSFGNWDTWAIGGIYFPTFELGDFGRWLTLLGAVFRISLLALLMAVVLLVARAPVARIGRSAAAEPGRAFLLGLAAELLFLPALIVASVGLIMTIIGIPLVAVLVPVAFFAAFVALVLGFTSIACWLGEWVEDRLGWRGRSAYLASAIGLILIVAPTVLSRTIGVLPDPLRFTGFGLLISGVVLEFIIWTIGLGATLMTGFGRWSTAPPPVPPVPQPGIVQIAG